MKMAREVFALEAYHYRSVDWKVWEAWRSRWFIKRRITVRDLAVRFE